VKHHESAIQQACVKWFRLQYPREVIFAIPNGGARSKVEAGIMKIEGVLAGVSDLFIMKNKINSGILAMISYEVKADTHGLFIEMKTPEGKQTPSQKAFQIKCKEKDYQYSICRSLDEFMEVVKEYMQ